MDSALDTTVEALEEMNKIELKKLPIDTLEKLVLILVALCRHNSKKIQSNNSLIAQLDGDLFDFAGTHEQLEAINKYSCSLLTELENEKAEQKKLVRKISDLQDERNRQLTATIKERDNKEAIVQKNMKLKDRIKELEISETELQRAKKEYKKKNGDLRAKVKLTEKELDKEKDKCKDLEGELEITKKDLQTERLISLEITDMSEIEKQKSEIQDELDKARKTHEKDMKDKHKEIERLKHDRELKIKDKERIYKIR